MVDISGATAILRHGKSPGKSKNLVLCFEKKTKTETLSESILKKTVTTDNTDATHVVVGIEKGYRTYLTCSHEDDESLKNHLKSFLLSASSGLVLSEPQDTEFLKMTQKRIFSIFSDINIDTKPTSLNEAVHLLQSMSEKLESDIPLNIWLLPLSRINPNIHNKVRKIGQDIVDNLVQQFELMEITESEVPLKTCLLPQSRGNLIIPNRVKKINNSVNHFESMEVACADRDNAFNQARNDDFLEEKTIATLKKMPENIVEPPAAISIPTKVTNPNENTVECSLTTPIPAESKPKQLDQIVWAPKITREKMYSISSSSSEIHPEFQNAMDFLKPLLSLDYHCRNLNKNHYVKISHGQVVSECEDEEEFYNSVKQPAQLETSASKNETSSADFVLQALSKCDDFLLQDVFQKMSACQLAVPVIANNDSKVIFHLWASRAIHKNWMNTGAETKSNEGFVAGTKMGCISFCRIGQTSVSKSKLVNGFISTAQGWPEHSYFLHRDVDSVSKFNGGCVEAVWYSPEGRPREHLKDLCCIYNLRGDTRDHHLQFQFLMKVSSVVVILIENTELNMEEKDLLKQTNAFVVLIDNGKAGSSKSLGKKKMLNSLNMNTKEISECLADSITPVFEKKLSLVEHADLALEMGFEVDEFREDCLTGKEAAKEFLMKIKKYDVNILKENVVPLQGELWKKWGKTDKEESRQQFKGEASPQEYSSQLRDEKSNLRQLQYQRGPSKEIVFFINKLLEFESSSAKKYFIDWCQMNLNEMSELFLPEILKEYNLAAKNLAALMKELENQQRNPHQRQGGQSMNSKIAQEKAKIKKFSEKFTVASFGIEHVFRELGQIFESYCDSRGKSNLQANSSLSEKTTLYLPKLMATLFLQGYPLEIMDGDASHVPLTWIKQVFSELKKMFKEELKVFVLSILGIQSSGKSTLLNTMFGSKFAVSSGRCTKGVYLQMVPVAEQWRKHFNCDYFIIMDSEGLRSPELSESFRHDNEIATLVACLANTTFINFWGQTFSKDMSDILQIAAHAYIRMKEVKIKSSFHMIFAGVPDVTAEDKNRLGVTKILDELNTMILRIVREEGRDDIFSGLSSIFPLIQEQFADAKIPEFLPALWQGSMRPPESRYGEIVKLLCERLCAGLMQTQCIAIRSQPITEFVNRLKDIWEAIKQENFIFGFRNSQAIEVYSELQKNYDREVTLFRNKFYGLSYKITEACFKHAQEIQDEDKGLHKYDSKISSDLSPKIDEWHMEVMNQLRTFASNQSDPDLASVHLSSFEIDIRNKVCSWQESEKRRAMLKIRSISKKEKTAAMKRAEFKKRCLQTARNVAGNLKKSNEYGVLANDSIKNAFINIYQKWTNEAKQEDEESFEYLDGLLIKIWNESFPELKEKLKRLNWRNEVELMKGVDESYTWLLENEESHPDLYNFVIEQHHLICVSNVLTKAINSLRSYSNKTYEQAQQKENTVMSRVKDIINDSKKKHASHFSSQATIAEILDYAAEELANANFQDKFGSFAFKKAFQKDFLLRIFGISVKKMVTVHKENFQTFSIATCLQNEYDELFKEFEIECKTADSDVRAASRFAKNIFGPIIVAQVKIILGSLVFDAVAAKTEFSQKNSMMFHILKELLTGPFVNVRDFVGDYKFYVKFWIKNKVVQFCKKDGFLNQLILSRVQSYTEVIKTCLRQMTEQSLEKHSSKLETWWTSLEVKLTTKDFFLQVGPLYQQFSTIALCYKEVLHSNMSVKLHFSAVNMARCLYLRQNVHIYGHWVVKLKN
jgi:hypothetical protein